MTAASYEASPIKRSRSIKAEVEARREALLAIVDDVGAIIAWIARRRAFRAWYNGEDLRSRPRRQGPARPGVKVAERTTG
jgi:hypothetical protein